MKIIILFFILGIITVSFVAITTAQTEETRGICTWQPVVDPVCVEGNVTFVNYCFTYNQTIIHNGTCAGHEAFYG